VGNRLMLGREKGDIVGRLGGDEFLIATPGGPLAQPQVSALLALQASIDTRITGNYQLGKTAIYYPGASVGVIEINPESCDADGALHAADEAMYQVKKNKVKKPFIPLN